MVAPPYCPRYNYPDQDDKEGGLRTKHDMKKSSNKIDVYLEIGSKRTFAGAIDWHGWCRSGRDKQSALQALVDYAPRYARVLRTSQLDFQPPKDLSAFNVVERIKGNATTDFGAPGIPPSRDTRSVDDAQLKRLEAILAACWRAFDAAIKKSQGKQLATGPRGGGRNQAKMIEHVMGAAVGYLGALGWKLEKNQESAIDKMRPAILEALAAASHGELPERGPRGGVHWTPRYFVRRSAWHILDHAWEIEDRIQKR